MTEAAGRETADGNKDSPRVKIATKFLKGGRRILDIGCNTGWFLDLADCKDKWGVDYDESFREIVEKKGHHFVKGWSWSLAFEDELFDRIHFGQTIAHMRKDLGIQSLAEVYRLLIVDGIAVISTVVGPAFTSGMLWHANQNMIVAPLISWFHHLEWEPNDLFLVLKHIGFHPIAFKVVPQVDEEDESFKSTRFVQVFVLTKKDKVDE